MSQRDPIRVFVTHAWEQSDDYLRVFEFLESARNFYYRNCSNPDQHPVDKSVEGLREELRAFLASELPPLTPGLARTFALHAEGWCKDMDLYTAFPDTVGPLPYRAMSNSPPAERPANDAAAAEYERTWNVRRQTGR